MTPQRDSLDDAIDRVAVAMTAVPDDGRSFAWAAGRETAHLTWHWPAVVAAALALIALVTWSPRAPQAPGPAVPTVSPAPLESAALGASAMVTRQAASSAPVDVPLASVQPRARVRAQASSREAGPTGSTFGLPALDGPHALQIDVLGAPLSLTMAEAEPAPLSLTQLEIAGLDPDRKE